MHNIEAAYEAMVEAVVEAHKNQRVTRWAASAAWWLSRRNVLASTAYWTDLAAILTQKLPADTQEPLRAQLSVQESARVDQIAGWPTIPDSITSILLFWNPESQPLNTAEAILAFSTAIQTAMNSKAAERNYDSIQSAITYRGDPNPVFAAEAEALFVWRSTVWTYSTNRLALVLAGEQEIPTIEAFLADMPTFTWPAAPEEGVVTAS